jgi:hypothetical protein
VDDVPVGPWITENATELEPSTTITFSADGFAKPYAGNGHKALDKFALDCYQDTERLIAGGNPEPAEGIVASRVAVIGGAVTGSVGQQLYRSVHRSQPPAYESDYSDYPDYGPGYSDYPDYGPDYSDYPDYPDYPGGYQARHHGKVK